MIVVGSSYFDNMNEFVYPVVSVEFYCRPSYVLPIF